LPGTSIAWVHREAVEVLSDVLSDAEQLSTAARKALAGEGDRALVFTPTSVGGGRALGAAFRGRRPVTEGVRLVEEDGGYRLANDLVAITISSEGLITSAVDLASGRETIPAGRPANLFQLHQDFPNMWD